jgi:hypothetical protein
VPRISESEALGACRERIGGLITGDEQRSVPLAQAMAWNACWKYRATALLREMAMSVVVATARPGLARN